MASGIVSDTLFPAASVVSQHRKFKLQDIAVINAHQQPSIFRSRLLLYKGAVMWSRAELRVRPFLACVALLCICEVIFGVEFSKLYNQKSQNVLK